MGHGVTNTQIDDEKELRRFLLENPDQWDYIDEALLNADSNRVSIIFWLPATPNGSDILDKIQSGVAESGIEPFLLESENVEDSAWLNEWKKHFKPLKIGARIVVCPEWEEYKRQPDEIVFTINPGNVFGTGLHQTTQMCIECLERYVTSGCSVLDLGCGSGILSIISVMLGAGNAFGCDLDPGAADIAMQNARLNKIPSESYQAVTGNAITNERLRNQILNRPKADIIVANIAADAIIALSETASRCIKPDGVFICSGIIPDRLDEVKEVIEANGFGIIESVAKDGWYSLAARYA